MTRHSRPLLSLLIFLFLVPFSITSRSVQVDDDDGDDDDSEWVEEDRVIRDQGREEELLRDDDVDDDDDDDDDVEDWELQHDRVLREVDETPETEKVEVDADDGERWMDEEEEEDDGEEGEPSEDKVKRREKRDSKEEEEDEVLSVAESIAVEEERARRRKEEQQQRQQQVQSTYKKRNIQNEGEEKEVAAVVITEDKEKEDGEDLIQEEEELMLTKLKEEVLKEVLEERRRAVKRKKTEEEKELDRAASEGLRRAAKEALIKDMGVIRAKGKIVVHATGGEERRGAAEGSDKKVVLEATDRESKDAAVKVVDALIQKKKEEEEEKKKGIKAPSLRSYRPADEEKEVQPIRKNNAEEEELKLAGEGRKLRARTLTLNRTTSLGGVSAPKTRTDTLQVRIEEEGEGDEDEKKVAAPAPPIEMMMSIEEIKPDKKRVATTDVYSTLGSNDRAAVTAAEATTDVYSRIGGGRRREEGQEATTDVYARIGGGRVAGRGMTTNVYARIGRERIKTTDVYSFVGGVGEGEKGGATTDVYSTIEPADGENSIMKGLPGNDDENKRRVEKFKVLRAASELLGRGGDSLEEKKRKLRALIKLAEVRMMLKKQEREEEKNKSLQVEEVKGEEGMTDEEAELDGLTAALKRAEQITKSLEKENEDLRDAESRRFEDDLERTVAREEARRRNYQKTEAKAMRNREMRYSPSTASSLPGYLNAYRDGRGSFFQVGRGAKIEHCKCGVSESSSRINHGKKEGKAASFMVSQIGGGGGGREKGRRVKRTENAGRRTATAKTRPWSVRLDIRAHRQPAIRCSGSLLNHRFVLTSARCLCGGGGGLGVSGGRGGEGNDDEGNGDLFCADPERTVYDIYPTSLKQIDAFIGAVDDGSRYVGTRAIVPKRKKTLSGRGGGDCGLLRVDPRVRFGPARMPVCLDGILQETLRVEHTVVYVEPDPLWGGIEGEEGKKETLLRRRQHPRRDQPCMTDEKLPKPYHLCSGRCHPGQTPAALDVYCREFLAALRRSHKHNGPGYDRTVAESEAFVVEDPQENRTRTCYQTSPGLHGWCRVQRQKENTLDYTGESDWGYCSSSCASSINLRVRGKSRHFKDPRFPILDVLQCSELSKDFDREGEFCAGWQEAQKQHKQQRQWQQHQEKSPPKFLWSRGERPVLMERYHDLGLREILKELASEAVRQQHQQRYSSPSHSSSECGDPILSGLRRRGSPALQWARARSDGSVRAVQVGLLSRLATGEDAVAGCQRQAAAVYSKLAERRAWIMAHIAEGGCDRYD